MRAPNNRVAPAPPPHMMTMPRHQQRYVSSVGGETSCSYGHAPVTTTGSPFAPQEVSAGFSGATMSPAMFYRRNAASKTGEECHCPSGWQQQQQHQPAIHVHPPPRDEWCPKCQPPCICQPCQCRRRAVRVRTCSGAWQDFVNCVESAAVNSMNCVIDGGVNLMNSCAGFFRGFCGCCFKSAPPCKRCNVGVDCPRHGLFCQQRHNYYAANFH